jgi:transcriptional antiterminator RfaH
MAKEWYVVQTKYAQERLADIELRRQKFTTFFPRIRVGSQGRYVIKPYFPGYLFVRFDVSKDRWQAANYTRGVARLFTCGEVPTRIRRGVVERMIAEAVNGDFVADDKMNEIIFEVGQGVKITAGPFSGMSGVVKASSHEKISVLLEGNFAARVKIKPMDFAPEALAAS